MSWNERGTVKTGLEIEGSPEAIFEASAVGLVTVCDNPAFVFALPVNDTRYSSFT